MCAARIVKGPAGVDVDSSQSLTSSLWDRARSRPTGRILASTSDGQTWEWVTWAELAERVRGVAAGLIAAGVEHGDRVALMSGTRLEWTVADLAILAAGGVSVPVYETSSAEQCAWILSDSGARIAFAGSADNAKSLDQAREAPEAAREGRAPDLREVLVFDDGGLDALAGRADDAARAEVDRRVAATGTDDLATLIYTSGTTGNPKGCMLTHGNLVTSGRGTRINLGPVFTDADASTLLFLPLAHSFARLIQFGCLESDVPMGYARGVDVLIDDIASFKPTFLLSVPRVFEKIFNTAQRNATGAKARVFDFAVTTSEEYSTERERGGVGILTQVKHAIADRLVYARLRERLGGRCQYAISGGAPLSDHVARFFDAAGIDILEGYGLTETSAYATVNPPGRKRIGTVGTVSAGVEIATDDDGEILIRGTSVMRGYYANEDATREAIDEDGWFRSGDLGGFDADGYLKITGRKKELIVTAGGKNVAPAVLEERLKAHRLVSQAMVVGDNRPYVAALVTLDPDELAAFAQEHGLSGGPRELGRTAPVRDELAKAVDHANAAVSKAESIRKVTVLDRDFTLEDQELTPTLKLRRSVISENFSDDIAELYAGRR